MNGDEKTMQLRIKKDELELLRKKSIEINKLLLKHGKPPMEDPTLLHEILKKSIPCATVNSKGEVVIEEE